MAGEECSVKPYLFALMQIQSIYITARSHTICYGIRLICGGG